MQLQNHPDLLDRLASAYALGTLRGGARRRFESMAREQPALRVAALVWAERFAAMTELQAAQQPSPNVWKRIDLTLQHQILDQPTKAASGLENALLGMQRHLRWWRGAALGGGLATALCTVAVWNLNSQQRALDQALAQARQQNTQTAQQLALAQKRPSIDYVAVLADDKATASMLVTFDPAKNTLTVKRVGDYQTTLDRSLQLWAIPGQGKPISLGVLSEDTVLQLPAAEAVLAPSSALAISLEPKGGVPSEGGPTGPVLFKGALLRTVL